MDFQGQPQNAGSNYPDVATNAAPPPPPKEFCVVRPNIPHTPYFQGFTGMGNHNPFAFPHHFMHPSVPGGFAPPPQGSPGAAIDLTDGSQKRPSIECVVEQSKPNKKKRASRKKVEIVDLDDTKDDVDLLKNAGHWKDHWVIQLVTIRGEMQNTFSSAPKQGVDNWSRLHTKLVSMCPDFPKDSEACRKKWSSIYNDYKEDKVMNMRLGSQRSEKCRWYTLVDEFMYDRANVVSHAHASAVSPDGPKSDTMPVSDMNTTEQRSMECTSKSSDPKRKDDVFMERCLGVITESSKSMMESLKRSDDIKIALLMSMQATMQKMVEKM